MKGIILAGGQGTRLSPTTKAISKHLLPVFDKPLIYYPLSVLMLADIRDVLIIVNPGDEEAYRRLLGSGEGLGISISYAIQDKPRGLAEAFIIGEDFIGDDTVCLILGDNIFYGPMLSQKLSEAKQVDAGACLFAYQVRDPHRFGVIDFDQDHKVLSIEEKPANPKSHFAAAGLYFYNNEVIEIAKNVEPSTRGELEITTVNNAYLARDNVKVQLLGRGYAWMDAGTPESLLEASNFVHTLQNRQGFQIACLEEIALAKSWISETEITYAIKSLGSSPYSNYLQDLIK